VTENQTKANRRLGATAAPLRDCACQVEDELEHKQEFAK
jgi:hypothetical protein